MVQDFPDEARFLDEKERQRATYRLQANQQASGYYEPFSSVFVWQAVLDWKTYAYMAIYGGCAGSLYAFSVFLPTIIKELGIAHSSTEINLLSVPHYAAAALLTIIIGWYADASNVRGNYNVVVSLLAASALQFYSVQSSRGLNTQELSLLHWGSTLLFH
jgi:hypothetical protein